MPKLKGHRYDLPASRVIGRAVHRAAHLAESRRRENPETTPAEAEAAARAVVLDRVWVRLAEERGILPAGYLRGFSGNLEAAFTQLNRRLGLELFDPALHRLGARSLTLLGEWDRELRRQLFWPPGMPPEVLGAIAENLAPRPERPGLYWTPAPLVSRLLDWAFAADHPTRREPFRLLDPACGTGVLLLAAWRRMIAAELAAVGSASPPLFSPLVKKPRGGRVLEPARKAELLAAHLFGVDCDPGALALLRRAAAIIILEGCRLADDPLPPLAALEKNFRLGDALLDRPVALQESLFRTRRGRPLLPLAWDDPNQGFGELGRAGGFSAVVCNPPWGGLKGKRRLPPYPPEAVGHLLEYWQAGSFRPNLFELFARLGVKRLREGGVLALAAPARLASAPAAAGLRRFFAAHGEPIALHFDEPWPGVAEPAIAFAFRKTAHPKKSHHLELSDARGRTATLPAGRWSKGDFAWPDKKSAADPRVARLEGADTKPLGEFFETGVGLIARKGKITADRQTELQLPLVRGEHVWPYRRAGQAWLEFTVRNLAGGTRNPAKLTAGPRLLVRKISGGLAACLDDSGHLVEQSLFFARLRHRRLCKGYDLRFFLGLLNSRLLSDYFRLRLVRRDALSAQLSKTALDALPLPHLQLRRPADRDRHDRLVAAVEERLRADADRAAKTDETIERLVEELYR